jgi:hypothetical protein
MGMLTLTFRGPFLFVVPPPTGGVPSTTVNIYAPVCDQHMGSVFFGDGSRPINGNRQNGSSMQYVIQGPAPHTGLISFQWNPLLSGDPAFICPDMQVPSVPTNVNPRLVYFYIIAPRPKIFYALDLVSDTEVVTGASPCNTFPVLLTSFRLHYDWDLKTAILLKAPTSVSSGAPFVITPPAGDPHPGAPVGFLPLGDTADIEFQYEGPGISDPDHQDASTCFAQLAQLAGLPWSLNFDNSGGIGGAAFRTGSDCTAIPLVIGVKN